MMTRSAALAGLLAVASIFWASPSSARCEGYTPQARPQNASRDIVGASVDDIIDRGYIAFAVYDNFPPWSYNLNGQPTGVDIEIGNLIAAEIGVEARFNLVQASENLEADLRNYIWQGPLIGGAVSNVMLHVPYDSNFACRVDQVVFTGQYAMESIAIAYRRDAYPDDPPVPAYFRFDTVAVENDSIADFYLSNLAGGSLRNNIRHYPTAAAAMQALADGEVKAAMGPRGQLEGGLTADSAIHQPPLPGFGVASWTLGVAVHQRYRYLAYAVDDAIAAALADGRIAAIYADYGLTFDLPER